MVGAGAVFTAAGLIVLLPALILPATTASDGGRGEGAGLAQFLAFAILFPTGGATLLIAAPVLTAGVLRQKLAQDPRTSRRHAKVGLGLIIGGLVVSVAAAVMAAQSTAALLIAGSATGFAGLLTTFIGGAFLGEAQRANRLAAGSRIHRHRDPAYRSRRHRLPQSLLPKTTSLQVLSLAW